MDRGYVGAQPAAKAAAPSAPAAAAPNAKSGSDAAYLTDAKFTLRTGIAEGKMVFLGVGGSIDGKANPVLTAAEGQIVQLTLINGEGTEHDIVFPDQDAKSPRVNGKGASTTIVFRATKSGDLIYFCSVPGHQLAGMQGQFLVTAMVAPRTLVEADISREFTDLPPPSASAVQRPSGSISSLSNGEIFVRQLRSIGIRDRPTSSRSPWQNAYAERLIGSIRRECIDHLVVFGERHLRQFLLSYKDYYNATRRALIYH